MTKTFLSGQDSILAMKLIVNQTLLVVSTIVSANSSVDVLKTYYRSVSKQLVQSYSIFVNKVRNFHVINNCFSFSFKKGPGLIVLKMLK